MLPTRTDLSKATGQWHSLVFLLLFPLFILSACASSNSHSTSSLSPSTPQDRGHLVIVGGGLKDDHAAVFNRFISLCADGPIGIIPIASGDGIKAGESTAERWRKYSGTRPVIVIPLTQNDAAKSDDPAIAQQIASCGGLWFTGGQQDRVVNVLRPQGKRSTCLESCFAVLQRNGVIGGTSAGAAIMSDPMITGGRSASAKSRDPDNEDNHHVTTSAGLGFFTFGLTDQHFIQRGRQGRLVDAMRDTNTSRGFGVSENCALVVDRASAECEVLGDEAAVWLLDATTASNISSDSAVLRLSILAGGDHFNANTSMITPSAGQRDVRLSGHTKIDAYYDDPWSSKAMHVALATLGIGQHGSATARNSTLSVTLMADDHSRVISNSATHTATYEKLLISISSSRAAHTPPSAPPPTP